MAVTERQRHQLFNWFEEQMGQERAATMIELMPPTGFAELATKQDLAELEAGWSLTKQLHHLAPRQPGHRGRRDGGHVHRLPLSRRTTGR